MCTVFNVLMMLQKKGETGVVDVGIISMLEWELESAGMMFTEFLGFV